MISVLYAAILALWLCWLALNVVKSRRRHRVRYADGGVEELQVARSAHSNATETIPIGLILLFALEYNSGSYWLVHTLGVLFVMARIVHGWGVLGDRLKARITGMQLTVFTIIGMALLNLFYLPYSRLLPL